MIALLLSLGCGVPREQVEADARAYAGTDGRLLGCAVAESWFGALAYRCDVEHRGAVLRLWCNDGGCSAEGR